MYVNLNKKIILHIHGLIAQLYGRVKSICSQIRLKWEI